MRAFRSVATVIEGEEKAIRARSARRQLQARAVGKLGDLAPACGRQIGRLSGLRDGERREVGRARRKSIRHQIVFLRQHRAGGVGETPANLDQARGAAKDLKLQVRKPANLARTGAPGPFRVAPPGAGTRTGRINKHQISPTNQMLKPLTLRADMQRIGFCTRPVEPFLQGGHTLWVHITGDQMALAFESLGKDQGLAPPPRRNSR